MRDWWGKRLFWPTELQTHSKSWRHLWPVDLSWEEDRWQRQRKTRSRFLIFHFFWNVPGPSSQVTGTRDRPTDRPIARSGGFPKVSVILSCQFSQRFSIKNTGMWSISWCSSVCAPKYISIFRAQILSRVSKIFEISNFVYHSGVLKTAYINVPSPTD